MSSADLFALIGDCIPNDHARQVGAVELIGPALKGRPAAPKVLDLGCGDGRSIDHFRSVDPQTDWHGLDIEGSPEVLTRSRQDASFHTYDGTHIPFEDGSFDIVYSCQVFEHVRHPEPVLREICRVLAPGGTFMGSVSYLEPYHSFSLWNYTPYGWHTLLRDAGLVPVEFRPGIDGTALLQRQYHGRHAASRGWFKSSPLNEEIDAWGASTKRSPALINLRKIQYCGHLVFIARRP